ncbi:YihY/virulence factor BrkB family protein [Capnocytophaga sp.]|uniref:YihY/virulence factor BrkB family protein n=1 Tax=Capnocytophaga sp. TaxID=44737 RepID=UPI0026DCEEAB|nr:YihY/virulence factor BrkB family protein [Capnocytophaga sp.]MDO5105294.1 YihY/virulence factor BrkB family protein [Capnocytophaga sp.]
MSKLIEQKLEKIPIIKNIVAFLKRISLSRNTFSLYDLLELYIVGIAKGALTYRASAISYSFFIALFPFLLFILNLIPYVPIEGFQTDVWLFINDLLPPGTNDFFSGIFFDIADKKRGGLLSSVFFLSIFLMTNGIVAIFGGFEFSYHVKITRTFIKQYLISLMVAIILGLLILAIVSMFIFYEVYLLPYFEKLGILHANEMLLKWSKIGFISIIAFFGTSILFFFGTHEGKKSKFFSVGSIFTLLLFGLTTYLFGIYIENFSQYNQLYGSIGALLIFLLYIWLNSNILLLGFELNAALLRLKKSS